LLLPLFTSDLHSVKTKITLEDTGKQVTSRRNSAGRSTGTVDSHLTGIHFFLSELSSDRILRLETVGDAGDVIDRELEKGTRLPRTIRLYLSSLIKFLEFYAVRKYFFGFSVSKNSSDIEEKLFKILYAVPHTMENILSLICSGSHLICSRSQCNMKILNSFSSISLEFFETENPKKYFRTA
jgi:hypothetical protein